MMSDKNINPLILDPINIDLNKLFSLSYTFENLRIFMSSLLKNQSLMTNKINELQNKLKQQIDITKNNVEKHTYYERKLQSLEAFIIKINIKEKKQKKYFSQKEKEKNHENKKDIIKSEQNKNEINENKEEFKKETFPNEEDINYLNNIDNIENINNFENIEENNEIKDEKNKERKFSVNDINIRKESSFSKEMEGEEKHEIYNELPINDYQEINNIKNRMIYIESKLKEFDLSLTQPKLHFIDDNIRKEEIDLIKNQIKNIGNKTEEIQIQENELQKKVEEISIKVLDFNIIDILSKNSSIGSSRIDSDKLIALNLEQKFKKKTSILDEKYKKAEEEISKIKKNFDNIKINFDVIEQNFNLTKSNVKDLKEEIMKSNLDYRNLLAEINGRLNENFIQKIEAQKRGVNKNLDKLRQQIKNINDKGILLDDDINKIGTSLSDSDLEYISELSKKVTDLEKQISLAFRKIESNKNKGSSEITKLENELIQKINQKDFFELNDKVNLQNTISNNIRENVERVEELTKKNMKDLNFFLRKIESLSGSVISMQNFIENFTNMKKENPIDLSIFLEKESFNEFIKIYNKEKKIFEKNFEEFRRIITDISEIIKTKSSENDFKNFEAIINNKLEELKLNCGKKFADKIDTSKSLKYLEAQIKYINEFNIKKEKNDNWLLAKKPVGGFSCASCETYIGDLKDKNDFIHWNKYPYRDKNVEKNYRIGNGFSRMLNMLNIDIKNSVDNLNINSYESDDDENINQNQPIHHQTNNTINFNISQGIKNSSSTKNRNSLKKNIIHVFNRNNLPKIKSLENIMNNENSLENHGMNKTIDSGNSVQTFSINKNENDDKKPHIVKVFKKNK